jgi:hypothetical protein
LRRRHGRASDEEAGFRIGFISGSSISAMRLAMPDMDLVSFGEMADAVETCIGRGHVKIGDEVTVGGPGTCACMPRGVPHAWESAGAETGRRVLFVYTPDMAGGLLEEQQRTHRKSASMNSQAIVAPCTLPFAERI